MMASETQFAQVSRDDSDPVFLGSYTWTVKELVEKFPPQWRHPNKLVVASIATPPGSTHEGSVTASRWRQGGIPERISTVTSVVPEAGFFTYPVPSDTATHWHLNFADPVLFGYGEGPLLAQDELQIVEHPCLASVGRAIEEGSHGVKDLCRSTVDSELGNTPILIHGAPRRCRLDTTELYGDRFARASEKQVREATTPIMPPTLTNILALAAMSPHEGYYSHEQIADILLTAYTGFRSMVLETRRNSSGNATSKPAAVLHTGHWGCGAFGGNKGLMCALQLLAAGTAGVERVHFYYGFTVNDQTAVEHGMQVAQLLSGSTVREVVDKLALAGYRWGMANENHVPFEPPENNLLDEQAKDSSSDI